MTRDMAEATWLIMAQTTPECQYLTVAYDRRR